MDNELILLCHNIEARYRATSACFCLDHDKLHLSVTAELLNPDNDEVSPRELKIAAMNYPYEGLGKEMRIRERHERWDEDDDVPHAYVDSNCHHVAVDAHLTVKTQEKNGLVIEFKVITDDIRCKGENAEHSTIEGCCTFAPVLLTELWRPENSAA